MAFFPHKPREPRSGVPGGVGPPGGGSLGLGDLPHDLLGVLVLLGQLLHQRRRRTRLEQAEGSAFQA